MTRQQAGLPQQMEEYLMEMRKMAALRLVWCPMDFRQSAEQKQLQINSHTPMTDLFILITNLTVKRGMRTMEEAEEAWWTWPPNKDE